MNGRAIQIAALGFSILACAIGAAAFIRAGEHSMASAAGSHPDSERIMSIESGVAGLRSDVDRLRSAPKSESGSREPASGTQDGSVPKDVLDRLKALEDSLADLKRAPAIHDRRDGAESAQDLAEKRRIATDPTADAQAKLAALRSLRGRRVEGQDARTPDVVLSMIDLADHSDDATVRADVYRQLHGVNDRNLRDAMLRALQSDPDPAVRGQCAKDINSFLPDPLVVDALRNAADNDESPNVRREALDTLSKQPK